MNKLFNKYLLLNNMTYPFYSALSPIHGRGLFANQYFPVGTILFKAINKNETVTNLAKLLNHSWKPNVILHQENDEYYAIARVPIFSGRELLVSYNDTPNCIKKANPYWK